MHQMGEVTDEVPSPATIAQNRYDNLSAGGSLRNSIKSPIEDNRQSNVESDHPRLVSTGSITPYYPFAPAEFLDD